jgi:hypothetical protein
MTQPNSLELKFGPSLLAIFSFWFSAKILFSKLLWDPLFDHPLLIVLSIFVLLWPVGMLFVHRHLYLRHSTSLARTFALAEVLCMLGIVVEFPVYSDVIPAKILAMGDTKCRSSEQPICVVDLGSREIGLNDFQVFAVVRSTAQFREESEEYIVVLNSALLGDRLRYATSAGAVTQKYDLGSKYKLIIFGSA